MLETKLEWIEGPFFLMLVFASLSKIAKNNSDISPPRHMHRSCYIIICPHCAM